MKKYIVTEEFLSWLIAEFQKRYRDFDYYYSTAEEYDKSVIKFIKSSIKKALKRKTHILIKEVEHE